MNQIMKITLRRKLPLLVNKPTLKKILEEERTHENKGTEFDLEHSALVNDELENQIKKINKRKEKLSSEASTTLDQTCMRQKQTI